MSEINEQVSIDLQKKKNDLVEAKPEEVMFNGKLHKIGWIRYYTNRRFSDAMVSEENVHKRHAKLASLILLNNIFKIKLFHWIYWRWLYYICDIDDVEVLRLLDVAKKKVQHEAYYLAIIYSTGMTDLMMTMTSKEAQHIQAEHRGAQHSV